jgi:transposase
MLLPEGAVAFEAGRDGFWLARWLNAHDIEAHVIHASSVAVTREHRRAKTDRLDTELLKRSFLGWLRGERDHCKMVAIRLIQCPAFAASSRHRCNNFSNVLSSTASFFKAGARRQARCRR